jgi:hypothetical protein
LYANLEPNAAARVAHGTAELLLNLTHVVGKTRARLEEIDRRAKAQETTTQDRRTLIVLSKACGFTTHLGSWTIDIWLENLGLEEFAPQFKSQAIDFETLIGMSESDLDFIGIKPFGPRRKIAKSIRQLEALSEHQESGRSPQSDIGERIPIGTRATPSKKLTESMSVPERKSGRSDLPVTNTSVRFSGKFGDRWVRFGTIAITGVGAVLLLLLAGLGGGIGTEIGKSVFGRDANQGANFRSEDLNRAIRDTAQELAKQLPLDLGNGTILQSVSSFGQVLQYNYTMETTRVAIDLAAFRRDLAGVQRSVCRDENMRWVLELGGSYRYVYVGSDGDQIGETTVSLEDC